MNPLFDFLYVLARVVEKIMVTQTVESSISRFLQVKDFPGLELYQTENSSRGAHRHVHFVHSIGIVDAGRKIHVTKNGSFDVGKGNVFVVQADESHGSRLSPGENYSSRCIRLSPELMSEFICEVTDGLQTNYYCPNPVVDDAELAQLVLRLHYVLQQETDLLEKQTCLMEVLSLLIARHTSGMRVADMDVNRNDKKAVLEVCRYLQDCFRENVSLETLSKISGLNLYYLCRAFTRSVGVSPHAYLTQVRLNHAKRLLASGEIPVEVAYETGFFDQSHFHKAFKKKFGLTPRQFMRDC